MSSASSPTSSPRLTNTNLPSGINLPAEYAQKASEYEAAQKKQQEKTEQLDRKKRESLLQTAVESKTDIEIVIEEEVRPDITAYTLDLLDSVGKSATSIATDDFKGLESRIFNELKLYQELAIKYGILQAKHNTTIGQLKIIQEQYEASEREKENLKEQIKSLKAENEDLKNTRVSTIKSDSNIFFSKTQFTSSLKPTSQEVGKYLGKISADLFSDFFLLQNKKSFIECNDHDPGEIYLYDFNDFEVKKHFELGDQENLPIIPDYSPTLGIWNISISLDDQYLTASTLNCDIIWNISNINKPYKILKKPEDCRHIASISSDGELILYKFKHLSGKLSLRRCSNHLESIATLESNYEVTPPPLFLKNNTWIASGTNQAIYLYSFNNGILKEENKLPYNNKKIESLITSSNGSVFSVLFCNKLKSKERHCIDIWRIKDIEEGKIQAPFFKIEGDFSGEEAITFSQDGKWFAFADNDKEQIKMLDIDFDENAIEYIFPYNKVAKKCSSINDIIFYKSGNDESLILRYYNNEFYEISINDIFLDEMSYKKNTLFENKTSISKEIPENEKKIQVTVDEKLLQSKEKLSDTKPNIVSNTLLGKKRGTSNEFVINTPTPESIEIANFFKSLAIRKKS